MENSFLSEFKQRDYFNQCTNSDELVQLMNKKKIRAYIGFDCTASSLHVGSLLQIMCLRLLQTWAPTNSFTRRRYNTDWRPFRKRRDKKNFI